MPNGQGVQEIDLTSAICTNPLWDDIHILTKRVEKRHANKARRGVTLQGLLALCISSQHSFFGTGVPPNPVTRSY